MTCGLALAAAAAGVVTAISARSRNDPASLRAQVRSALQEKRYGAAEDALRRLEELVELEPADWLSRAQVEIARNQSQHALMALGQVPPGAKEASAARLWEAYIGIYLHRARTTEKALLEVVRIDPAQVKARRELVGLYARQQRQAELDRQYQAWVAHGTPGFDDLFGWCAPGGSEGELEETAQVLEQYVQADSEDRRSRLALADMLRRLGQLDAAERVIAHLASDDPEALLARAQVAHDRGDLDAATRLLDRAGKGGPLVARMRGRLALERGDGPDAVKHFRQAIGLLPDDRDVLFGLGQALRMAGDRAAAQPYLKAAWERDEFLHSLEHSSTPSAKKDPQVLRKLGAACEHLGRMGQARGWYKLAVATNPLDQEAQQALARLGRADQSAEAP